MNYFVSRCFHKPEKVFDIDGVEYYAADEDGADSFNGDVMINLTRITHNPIHFMPSQLSRHLDIPYQEIMIPWPDYGIPRVKVSFWKALHTIARRKKWKKVCIHCGHGHGRTGTALSALLVANLGYSAIDAVDIVRTNHCEDTVESPDQCTYLQNIDEHYNGRQPTEETLPMPAMLTNYLYQKTKEETEDKLNEEDSGSN
jgi:hypothetical protein